mgnify:CR=1 FL=1
MLVAGSTSRRGCIGINTCQRSKGAGVSVRRSVQMMVRKKRREEPLPMRDGFGATQNEVGLGTKELGQNSLVRLLPHNVVACVFCGGLCSTCSEAVSTALC